MDRTHVLATPGLDRHATYVALSRHRDSVELHYARDDFADARRLERTLSRERAKDMASDYARDAPDRREIRVPDRVVPKPPSRDIFAGLRLNMPEPARPVSDREGAGASLHKAVERYARRVADMMRLREQRLPDLPHQQEALNRAGEALEKLRPNAGRDITNAFQRQPELISQAAGGKTAAVIRAMTLEAEVRTNPKLRADRFVERWQRMQAQYAALERSGDMRGAQTVSESMQGVAKALVRDPQLESILRTRTRELGLPPMIQRSIGQSLSDWIGIGRGRGIGR